jgi:hypothetical protein
LTPEPRTTAPTIQKARPPSGWTIAIGAAILLVLAGGWAAKMHFDAEAEAKREELAQGVRQLKGVVQDSQMLAVASSPSAPAATTSPRATTLAPVPVTTEAEVVADAARFIGELSKRNQQTATNYAARLHQLNSDGWLSPDAMTKADYRGKQRANLQLATQALDQYEGEVRQGFRDMKEYGARLAAASAPGATFNRGMLDTMPESERVAGEMLTTERLIMKSVASLYDFLDRADVPRTVQRGQPVFERPEHQETYNAAFAEIRRLGIRSEEANREALAQQRKKIDTLGDVERKLSSKR